MSVFGKVVAMSFILLLAIVAVVGLMAVFGKTATTPFVDSYNNTATNISNSTQDEVIKQVNTGSQIGVAAIYIIGGLLLIVVIMLAVVFVLRKK